LKKLMALLLSFVICLLLSSCTPLSNSNAISYNNDASEMYYNGHTYIDYNNTNGKYRFDVKQNTECWVEIATKPYGIFYVLDAVTTYYGNDKENPAFITNSRTIDFYVREDLTLDYDSELSACDTQEPYDFKISDVITGNPIAYGIDQKKNFTSICNFFVAFKEFPCVKLWIEIYEYEGKLYLQDVWDSDYYEITDAFKNDIYRLGLNAFNYH